MKIIGIDWNSSVHNKAPEAALLSTGVPALFMKPDSAWQRCNKPFFVPDELGRIDIEAHLVVRIGRLGKSIPQRFAHRYADAVTVGIDFTAHDVLEAARQGGAPWDLAKGFDGAAVTGEWVPLADLGQDVLGQALAYRLDRNGETVQRGGTEALRWSISELIAYCSRFLTLKTGDMLFTGAAPGAVAAAIGDNLTGWLNDRQVLELRCR